MKALWDKIFCLLIVMVIMVSGASAQNGTIQESLVIDSSVLGKQVEYSVYLPPDYEETNRNYPILYLLHGYSDNETSWIQFGQVKKIADQTVDDVDVSSMIIVMPDAGISWYINSHDGGTRYEDFFIDEFIPEIESIYRVRSEKEFRAIAGISMGGFGTLVMALKHHDLFSAAAPLSSAVYQEETVVNMGQETWDWVFRIPYEQGLTGRDRLTEHYRSYSILDLIEQGQVDSLNSVSYYIDCGDDDFLVKGNMALHSAMIDKGIEHEFRIRDGGHGWEYWRAALPEVLKFVSQSFHR